MCRSVHTVFEVPFPLGKLQKPGRIVETGFIGEIVSSSSECVDIADVRPNVFGHQPRGDGEVLVMIVGDPGAVREGVSQICRDGSHENKIDHGDDGFQWIPVCFTPRVVETIFPTDRASTWNAFWRGHGRTAPV